MYSIHDRNTFYQLQKYIDSIRNVIKVGYFPFALIGFKDDLEREVSYQEALEFAKKNNIVYFTETNRRYKNEILISMCKILEYIKFGKINLKSNYILGDLYKRNHFNFKKGKLEDIFMHFID